MAFFIVLTILLVIAALAPRYGVDSRGLGESSHASHWPGLPETPHPAVAGPMALGGERPTGLPVSRAVPRPRAELRQQGDLVR